MFKKFLQYILFSLLSLFIFLLLIVVIAAFTMGPSVSRNSLLVLNLTGPLMEEAPSGWKEKLLMGDVLTTRDILTSLEKAKKDNRIRGLLVTAMGAQIGFAQAQDIRQAIKDFAAKKPVYGFIEDGDTLEYYVCSAAPKIYMAPAGEGGITLVGLRAEVPFFKGTLDKLGIEAQMDHIGDFKSASDIWTRQDMSEAVRENTNWLLDSLYDRITADIAKDRGISQEKVKQLVDRAPLIRNESLDGGLVNGLKYRDELDDLIKRDLKMDEIRRISVLEYKQPTFWESGKGAGNKIAIIFATGTITPGESAKGYEENYMGSSTIIQAIREAKKDKSVKAILLRVDSPGGSAVASDLIWREVVIARKDKPVVVSMGDVAASGGYYIAMGANKIFAEPSTITGSIGVIFGKFYMKGLYDKIGFTKEVIKRGEHADLFSEYVPFDQSEWDVIHKQMWSVYSTFTEKAAQGRHKTQEQIDAIGRGRVWTGEQALKIGLVDALGGMNEAIRSAKQLAKMKDTDEVGFSIYPAKKQSLFDMLGGAESQLKLPEEVNTLLSYARLADREHFLLLMPYRIRVD